MEKKQNKDKGGSPFSLKELKKRSETKELKIAYETK
jgi:hypothetical protein